MNKNKTILASTYAVNPYKGSEDAMGWNFIIQIARFNKVIAITRENNQENIEKYMLENPKEEYKNIQFLYFDLPYYMRFWKKGGRGAMLYYLMWQKGIVGYIKKQQIKYDIVHNINFHNDWTPSYLWKLNKPFVWGPIGHHPLIPSQYLKPYHKKYWIKDRMTWLIKKTFWNVSLSLKKTVEKADVIYCMNESVQEVLHIKPEKMVIFPSVATEDFGCDLNVKSNKFTLISAGRLVPLKGYDLSILGFASFINELPQEERKNCELVIVGSGEELNFYKQLCNEHDIDAYVKFVEWIDRQELMELFREAAIFLFPSHEGAGMVVAEALSFGLPVICLKNCGPGEFIDKSCGYAIPIQNYKATVSDIGKAISELYNNPKLKDDMSEKARLKFEEKFHWNRRGEMLHTIYSKL
ncbi:MAG: glycosyltransferase family 4 protein [Flavobacteriaceae bacterium]|nr:glycosyltransferase family 4 protein [Flavobacteriaceae bacterium]